jgi:hypothetical protein
MAGRRKKMKFICEDNDRDIIKILRDAVPCWNCQELTTFFDIDFGAYLCSTECQDTKLKEFGEAYNRTSVGLESEKK